MKEILVYGQIGWDVVPSDIMRQLKDAGDEDILLRIHSMGGSVFDGIAILSMLREHPGEIHAQIDGVAMSMAASIAISAETLTMPSNGWLMFHEASWSGGGSSKELKQKAEILDVFNADLGQQLSDIMNITPEDVAKLLADEIWLDGDAANEAGFVSELMGNEALAANAEDKFKNAPDSFKLSKLDYLAQHGKDSLRQQENDMSLLEKIGLKKGEEKAPEEVEAVEAIDETADQAKAEHALEIEAMQGQVDEQSETITALTSELDEAKAEIDALAASHAEKLGELETAHAEALATKDEEVQAADESATAKANEQVASLGVPPVAVVSEDELEGKSEVVSLEAYQALEGADKAAYLKNHADALRKLEQEAK